MKAGIAIGNQLLIDPTKIVPGGKIISAYWSRSSWTGFCIWDVPSFENLLPLLESMRNVGFNTDVYPVDIFETAISKWEKVAEEMAKM